MEVDMFSSLKRILLAGALAVFIAAPAQAGTAQTQTKTLLAPDISKQVVLRVNGVEFTRENLDIAVNNLMPMMSFHSSITPEHLKKIQKTAINQMINDELVYKSAKEQKTADVKAKEIDEAIEALKKSLPKGKTLDEVLKNSNMTMQELREHFRKKIAVKQVSEKKRDEFKKKAPEIVNDAFIKDYYLKNLNKFKEPEQIHLRSLLIKADPSGGQRVWNEALKKAQDIAAQARSGKDFAELAKKYSEDQNAKAGGDMGWSHKGSLFEEIDAAAEKMKIGDVSDPVMTIYGYHVLKLEGRKPPVQKKLEELNKENLKKELEAKEYKRLWEDWLKGLRKQAKVEILAEELK